MMLLLSPALTMYALIPFPIMVLVVYKLMGKVHDIFKEAQEQFSKITTHAQENISGIRVVKAYVQEEREKRYFDQLNQGYIEINLRLVKIRGILWASMSFFSGTGVLLILWIGGSKVAAGEITLGVLVAFFALLGRMTWPMIALGWVINLTQQGIECQGAHPFAGRQQRHCRVPPFLIECHENNMQESKTCFRVMLVPDMCETKQSQ